MNGQVIFGKQYLPVSIAIFIIFPLIAGEQLRNLIFMKQYVIDELRPKDYQMIKSFMDEKFGSSNVDGVYWIELDHNILTPIQKEHTECQPFYFAAVLELNIIAFELLVRTKNRMRCSCMGYATENQRNWLIRVADAIFDKLGIKT